MPFQQYIKKSRALKFHCHLQVALRAKVERENHDLNKEKIKLDRAEQRKTLIEALSTAGNMIATGMFCLLEVV